MSSSPNVKAASRSGTPTGGSRGGRRRYSLNQGAVQERESKASTSLGDANFSRSDSSVRRVILNYGSPTNPHSGNYSVWFESLPHQFKAKYPLLVGIFYHQNFEYPDYPRPEKHRRLVELTRESARRPPQPQAPEGLDAKLIEEHETSYAEWEANEVIFKEEYDLEKRIYLSAVSEHQKLLVKAQEQKPGFYAEIRELISAGSISVFKKHKADFETTVDQASNVKELLTLARQTHSIAITQDHISDRAVIYKLWDEIKQHQNETHWAYHERWNQLRARYVAAEGECREPKYEAQKFLLSLWPRPLVTTFITETSNEVRLRQNPDLWPQSADEAYEAISQFKIITTGTHGGFQTMRSGNGSLMDRSPIQSQCA